MLHGESFKRLAPPGNTKGRKHPQSTSVDKSLHIVPRESICVAIIYVGLSILQTQSLKEFHTENATKACHRQGRQKHNETKNSDNQSK